MQWTETLVWFASAVWDVIIRALSLDSTLLQAADAHPASTAIIVTVAVLAGASQLLGQGITLRANRIKPRRFVVLLFLNGLLFGMGLAVWSLTTWLVARLYGIDTSFTMVMRIIALSSAPLLLSFLVFLPYLGPFIARLLAVWSFLIVLDIIQQTFQVTLGVALVIVGTGWLLTVLLSWTIGKPVVALRNWLWRHVVGTRMDAHMQDLLVALDREQSQTPPRTPPGKGGTA